jgi:hypothetical protein
VIGRDFHFALRASILFELFVAGFQKCDNFFKRDPALTIGHREIEPAISG